MFLGILNTTFFNISNYLSCLEVRICSIENVVITRLSLYRMSVYRGLTEKTFPACTTPQTNVRQRFLSPRFRVCVCGGGGGEGEVGCAEKCHAKDTY